MSLVKQCLNVWSSVSEGQERLKECFRVRMSDLGGFQRLKEDIFGCVRVKVIDLDV